MIHQRERLPLSLEPRQNQARIHTRLDDLQRDLAANGTLLLREIHDAESALTHFREDPVRTDPIAAHSRWTLPAARW